MYCILQNKSLPVYMGLIWHAFDDLGQRSVIFYKLMISQLMTLIFTRIFYSVLILECSNSQIISTFLITVLWSCLHSPVYISPWLEQTLLQEGSSELNLIAYYLCILLITVWWWYNHCWIEQYLVAVFKSGQWSWVLYCASIIISQCISEFAIFSLFLLIQSLTHLQVFFTNYCLWWCH